MTERSTQAAHKSGQPVLIVLNCYLWYPEPELGIEIEIVVPGEEISVCQLCEWQTHHLGKTGPVTTIVISNMYRSDDGGIARTLDHDRTRIQAGITDTLAGIGRQCVITFHFSIDNDGDGGASSANRLAEMIKRTHSRLRLQPLQQNDQLAYIEEFCAKIRRA